MAKFTTGHLNAIADLLKGIPVAEVLPKQHQGKLPYISVHYWVLMDHFCEMFEKSNPNFDREKFLRVADCPYFEEVIMGIPCIDGKPIKN